MLLRLLLPGRRVIFPDITYSFYPVYAHLFQLDFEEIPLNEDFSFPVEKFLRGSGGAVVCNPNAPTGRTLPLRKICRILEADPNRVVIVDEAYADFGARSAVELLNRYPNLVTVHTLSKSRSLAGMRVGYALGNPEVMAAVRCVKNSFNSYPLDRLALAAGEAAIRDVEYFEESRRKVITTRERTTARRGNWAFSSMIPTPTLFLLRIPLLAEKSFSRACGTAGSWSVGLTNPASGTISACPSALTRRWRRCAGPARIF